MKLNELQGSGGLHGMKLNELQRMIEGSGGLYGMKLNESQRNFLQFAV
jgi:hypothetical protein